MVEIIYVNFNREMQDHAKVLEARVKAGHDAQGKRIKKFNDVYGKLEELVRRTLPLILYCCITHVLFSWLGFDYAIIGRRDRQDLPTNRRTQT